MRLAVSSTASALFGQRKLRSFTVDARYWETAAWRSGLTIPISVCARKWQIRALYLRDAEKPHRRSGPNFSDLPTCLQSDRVLIADRGRAVTKLNRSLSCITHPRRTLFALQQRASCVFDKHLISGQILLLTKDPGSTSVTLHKPSCCSA